MGHLKLMLCYVFKIIIVNMFLLILPLNRCLNSCSNFTMDSSISFACLWLIFSLTYLPSLWSLKGTIFCICSDCLYYDSDPWPNLLITKEITLRNFPFHFDVMCHPTQQVNPAWVKSYCIQIFPLLIHKIMNY